MEVSFIWGDEDRINSYKTLDYPKLKLYFVADIGQTCFLFTYLYLSCFYIIEVLNELFAARKVEAFHGEFMRYTSFIDAVAYCIIPINIGERWMEYARISSYCTSLSGWSIVASTSIGA